MKIINKACLPYEVIGRVIDGYIEENYGATCYYGKCEYMLIEYKDEEYKVQIRYLKSYVEWGFYEVEE